jgi:hypothetical protein
MAIVLPHTFVNGVGNVIDAPAVNENFNALNNALPTTTIATLQSQVSALQGQVAALETQIADSITLTQLNTILASYATTAALNAAKIGVTNGTDVPAGQIGEYHEAAAISPTGVAANGINYSVISLPPLSAGDWQIWGSANFTMTGVTTDIRIRAVVGTEYPLTDDFGVINNVEGGLIGGPRVIAPMRRLNFTTPQTISLWVSVNLVDPGTVTFPIPVGGYVAARRMT